MGTACAAEAFKLKICEALGLESLAVHRIIIDARYSGPLQVFVELAGSTQALDLDWRQGLEGADITILNKK